MKIAVVGATGLVGSVMIKVLEAQDLPISELFLAASEKSVGTELMFRNKAHQVCSIESALAAKPDIALFSAGSDVSLQWTPKFAEAGAYVIDNSSAWRMKEGIPLIIPEVNIEALSKNDRLIANPNCSTIQMLVALNPLRRKFGLASITVTTYQAVTGSGMKGIAQLEAERHKHPHQKCYKRNIDLNCIPQCDDFTANGYTKEEMKLVNETHKIFDDLSITVNPTAVRVPVTGGHSESVVVKLKTKANLQEVMTALQSAPGLIVTAAAEDYPTALDVAGRDEVFVGRIRRDLTDESIWNLWIVADNLRKGAATNAVQIAVYVAKRFLL